MPLEVLSTPYGRPALGRLRACIAAANDFDHAKVKADADAYKLSDAFAKIDVENVKAHLYDQAVPG